jgi:hypothetical protein
MPISPSWFPHVVTRKRAPAGPPGGKGDVDYSAVVADTILARVERKRIVTRSAQGVEVHVATIMATTSDVKTGDVFWFPAIGGAPADDTTDFNKARRPKNIVVASDKRATWSLWEVEF